MVLLHRKQNYRPSNRGLTGDMSRSPTLPKKLLRRGCALNGGAGGGGGSFLSLGGDESDALDRDEASSCFSSHLCCCCCTVDVEASAPTLLLRPNEGMRVGLRFAAASAAARPCAASQSPSGSSVYRV